MTTKTTSLQLNTEQLERLLDGLESIMEPLPVMDDQDRDEAQHQALLCRLRTALTRVQDANTTITSCADR